MSKPATEEYKLDIVNKVLALMPEMSANRACKQVGVPHSSFNLWVRANDKTRERYTSARYDYQELLLEKLFAIVDIDPDKIRTDSRGRLDNGEIQLLRLKADVIKWALSKLAPKRYGERLALASDEDNPLQVVAIKRVVIDKLIESNNSYQETTPTPSTSIEEDG